MTDELTEEEVRALLEGIRARGGIRFKSEEEFREAVKLMYIEHGVDILFDLLVAFWKKDQRQIH